MLCVVLYCDIQCCNVPVVCCAMDVFRFSVLPPQGWSAGTPSLHATSTQAPQEPLLSPGPHFYPQGLHPPAPHCPYPSLSPAPALCTPCLQWLRAPPQVSVQASFTFPCSHPDPYIPMTFTLVFYHLDSCGGCSPKKSTHYLKHFIAPSSKVSMFLFCNYPIFPCFLSKLAIAGTYL